jgi:hypothetical protein
LVESEQVQQNLFGVRSVLIIAAALEAFEAILDLPLIVDRPNLLFGPWGEMPTTFMGIILAKAHVIAHPLLAIAALTFSVAGNVRIALVGLGTISVLTWLSFLPVVLHDGLPLEGWWAIQWTIAQLFAFPVLAGISILLAVSTSLYKLSAGLIAIPTAYNTFGMGLFVINVVIANL